MMAATKVEVTLYSRGYRARTPVDEVDPDQAYLHERLIRWGLWACSKAQGRGLASIEGLYNKAGTPPSTAPLSADPAIMAVERAVTRMPKEHRDTMRRLYVYRMTPTSICQMVRMRYEAWPAWVRVCRAMVGNLLRRHVG